MDLDEYEHRYGIINRCDITQARERVANRHGKSRQELIALYGDVPARDRRTLLILLAFVICFGCYLIYEGAKGNGNPNSYIMTPPASVPFGTAGQ